MCRYMETFAAENNLQENIRYETEVLNIKRGDERPSSSWHVTVENKRTGTRDIWKYSRIVLCTGVRRLFFFDMNIRFIFSCRFFLRDVVPHLFHPRCRHMLQNRWGSVALSSIPVNSAVS